MSVAVAAVLVFLLALLPRLASLDAYVTIDESRWIQRSADFQALVAQGDPEDTFIIGHPGVTTMWTAFLGMGPERAESMSFHEGRTDVTHRDGYLEALIAARRPFALLAAAGAALLTILASRLVGVMAALVAGGLIALEPFLIAHARVVHLDSALTVYTSVALLAALVWVRGGALTWMALSGAAAGLAFLTKAPSVYVLGFIPLVALLNCLPRRQERLEALVRAIRGLALWGLVGIAVALAAWPALRADPFGTLLLMVRFTERVGGGEHDNFFAGQPLEDPGPLFYPVALIFRLSPITLFGLILLAVGWRVVVGKERGLIVTLALYCLGFAAMMSLAPKKFDRYLLPIFPILGLLAGLGLYRITSWIVRRLDAIGGAPRTYRSPRGLSRWRPRLAMGFDTGGAVIAAMVLSLLALHAVPLLAVHPYYLAYYNPLLGGGAVAQRIVLVGWGEGLDQVARYLNARPRPLGEPTVATSYHRVLQAQLEGSAVPLEQVRMADYVVPYVNTLQRGAEREPLAPFLEAGTPDHVVRINGIEYARVYRGPRFPIRATLDADFGESAVLAEYVLAPGSVSLRPSEEIQLLLRWNRPGPAGLLAAVELIDGSGRAIARDERPVGADGPDEAGRVAETHRLTIPTRAPSGEYALALRILDPRSRSALRVAGGAEALTLQQVSVERSP